MKTEQPSESATAASSSDSATAAPPSESANATLLSESNTPTLRILLTSLGRLYPWPVAPSEELSLALSFLDWGVTDDALVRGGNGAGIVVGIVLLVPALFVPAALRLVVVLGAVSVGLLTTYAIHSLPRLLATARRTSALGTAPELVSRAVLSMRLAPTPERAAQFAARSGEGVLASSLRTHVRQADHTAESGLSSFGEAWADLFPSLRRSCALVTAAGRAPERDRDRLLDRALAVVLDGTREQMQTFAASIRAPATALYAFGVLLPMALVALLPAAGAAGLAVTPLSVVLVYNLVLPGVVVAASAWLLARRPVAFPPPNVTSDHPDVAERTWLALGCGAGLGLTAWVVTAPVFPAWGPPLAAAGLGTGTALWIQYQPVVGVYEWVRDVEDGLSDALVLLGRRVANGRAVERALAETAVELDGPMGAILERGARQQRQLQVGVRDAFLGEYGALDTLPSTRVRGSMALVALAAEEGRPAGVALLSLADHIEDLTEIEREATHSLRQVCGTLTSTAMVFGPMVGGATVALAGSIGGQETLPGGEHSLLWLGGPVGVYVLVLAVLLTALATGLTRGFDRSLVGYRVGRTLVCATSTFLCSYLVVGGLA